MGGRGGSVLLLITWDSYLNYLVYGEGPHPLALSNPLAVPCLVYLRVAVQHMKLVPGYIYIATCGLFAAAILCGIGETST